MIFRRATANHPQGTPTVKRLLLMAMALLTIAGSGCAVCSNTYDCYYPAYGGIRPRGNMTHGRVGSVFNDASAHAGAATGPEAALGPSGGPELLPALPNGAANPGFADEIFNPLPAGDASGGQPTPAIPNLLDAAEAAEAPGAFAVQLVAALEALSDEPSQPAAGGADPNAPFDFTAP